MWLQGEIVLAILLLATCRGIPQQLNKKGTETLKRTVETYSYSVPTEKYDENQRNVKSKVIVETIKSISPSEYISSSGYLGSSIEASPASGKFPVGTVTFNAFEPDPSKKSATGGSLNAEPVASIKNKSSYKYYTNDIRSSSQKPTDSSTQITSTNSPTPVRTTSVEPATTLPPDYQYASHSSSYLQSSASRETSSSEKPLNIITLTRGRPNTERYRLQKLIKKPAKIESRISDSKPEETGFNGYHYDVGSLSFESKHTSSQGGGMMGASYMRSSSPFYNYHVMLD